MLKHTRNFVIIAHVDHGKSTLADRLLEHTGTVEPRLMKPQYLDQLELERERGITIKMAPVRMRYTLDAIPYTLNLIDTPGHSDFRYEVSRALAAVEGAVLLVDATQGIQAQTLANYEAARAAGLAIVGAVNKIDVADTAQTEEAVRALSELTGMPAHAILCVSGKTGAGVPELLCAIVEHVPPPRFLNPIPHILTPDVSRALIFDSIYDDHKGVIAFVRVFSGAFPPRADVLFAGTEVRTRVKELGYFFPALTPGKELANGDIGYCATGIKDPGALTIGDTMLLATAHATARAHELALPGYERPQPVVFVSFYPEDPDAYEELKRSLARLRLSDASLVFEPDANEVLGRGFKGGFLGRLHFEITAERLAREYRIPTVHSFPSVEYRVKEKGVRADDAAWRTVTNPRDFPDSYLDAEEPIVRAEILSPAAHLGAILQLTQTFRFSGLETRSFRNAVRITAILPLAELIRDFDDRLKAVSHGFASFTYAVSGWMRGELARLTILVAGMEVPGLTRVLPAAQIEREARRTVEKLKELLPPVQFAQPVQAVAFGRIVARETIPASRKDVTDYLYGGDRSRKMKLWKKQQRGKGRMKERGLTAPPKVPAAAFRELLKSS